MTLQERQRKSNGKVSIISPGLYAQWRARSWAAHTFAERPEKSPLTERVLQLIWQAQRLHSDQLQTTDGQAVHVWHPGFWNHEAGPDFLDAVIQIGSARARPGDIEVDLSPRGWHAHGHDTNPAYKNVILHVVWEADASAVPALPTLPLKARLDAPLEELASWLRKEPGPELASLLGQCSPALRCLPSDDLSELMRQSAEVRLQTKAAYLQPRARQVGWEQALWEGLFGALGYKHNVWPMQRIAEALPSLAAGMAPGSTLALQARLLGVSGLLPAQVDLSPGPAHSYLRQIWDFWWRDREQFADLTLPQTLWRLNGLRPANNPLRRLALAAHWITELDLPNALERWFASVQPDSKMASSLWKLLQTKEDDFWSRHWTFRSAPLPCPQPLIGPQRVTDLAVNVILPWIWVRAATGQNAEWQQRARDCYFAWPKSEDNAVLRLARRRLFGTAKLFASRTAADQQGLLQIVRDFCDYSTAVCENCPFPALLKSPEKPT